MGKELSFEELKEQGGVCTHYAEYYKYNLESLGFNAKLEDIYVNEDSKEKAKGHEFTISWNDDLTVYCILDQINGFCINLDANKSKEEK